MSLLQATFREFLLILLRRRDIKDWNILFVYKALQ